MSEQPKPEPNQQPNPHLQLAKQRLQEWDEARLREVDWRREARAVLWVQRIAADAVRNAADFRRQTTKSNTDSLNNC